MSVSVSVCVCWGGGGGPLLTQGYKQELTNRDSSNRKLFAHQWQIIHPGQPRSVGKPQPSFITNPLADQLSHAMNEC